MKKMNFVIRSASDLSNTSVESFGDLNEILDLINKHDCPVIIGKNDYLEEYERDEEKFKKKYVQSLVKKVQHWKQKEARYTITIYDDYME